MQANSTTSSAPTPLDDKKAESTDIERLEKEVATLQTEVIQLLKTLDKKIGRHDFKDAIKDVLLCVEEAPSHHPYYLAAVTQPLIESALRRYTEQKPAPADAKEMEAAYKTIESHLTEITGKNSAYIKLKFKDTLEEVTAKERTYAEETLKKINAATNKAEIEKYRTELRQWQNDLTSEIYSHEIALAAKTTNSILTSWDNVYKNNIALLLRSTTIKIDVRISELDHIRFLKLKDSPYIKLHNIRTAISAKLEKFRQELLKKISAIYTDTKHPLTKEPVNLEANLNLFSMLSHILNKKESYAQFGEVFCIHGHLNHLEIIEVTIKKYVLICEWQQRISPVGSMTTLQDCMVDLAGELKHFNESREMHYAIQWYPEYKNEHTKFASAHALLAYKYLIPDTGESLANDLQKTLSNASELLAIPTISALFAGYQEHLHSKIKGIEGSWARLRGHSTIRTNDMIMLPMELIDRAEGAENKLLLLKAALLKQLTTLANDEKKTVTQRIEEITGFLKSIPGANDAEKFTDTIWTGAIPVRNKIRNLSAAEIIALPREDENPEAKSHGKKMLKELSNILLMITYATNPDEKAYQAALKSSGLAFFTPAGGPGPQPNATAAAGGPVPAPLLDSKKISSKSG